MFNVKKALRYARRHPLPLWAGFSVIGAIHLWRVRERHLAQVQERRPATATAKAYKALPLNTMSRWWGSMHSLELPGWTKPIILGGYARLFGCNMEEAEETDVTQYKNLGELFRRRLKPGVRTVDTSLDCGMVSPCDGKITYIGPVVSQQLEPVKGVTYPLAEFLGTNLNAEDSNVFNLYQCVIYLAPGDYHGFHAPADWLVKQRHHFDGLLLSVSPSVVKAIDRLFSVNERVVYLGSWGEEGDKFFAFAAVGATNVGSIVIPSDPTLSTNKKKSEESKKCATFQDWRVKKGDYFGEFNLGSSIVLIFESKDKLSFNVNNGDRVKMGQRIATTCHNSDLQ